MRRYTVDLPDQKVRVWAERVGGTLWFHWRGQTQCIEKAAVQSKSKSGTALLGSGDVLSPMPGKITKVLVNPGAEVQVNTPLIVMEAMKMEYTLSAGIAGTVSEILCRVSDQVLLNQLLAKVTAGAGDEG